MYEIIEARQIMLAAIAGAMVVMLGAVHAFFLALARLRRSKVFMNWAWISYAAFFLAVMTLAWTLRLNGFWTWIVLVMLLGYLLAPRAIWRLSVATHPQHQEGSSGETPEAGTGGMNHE